MVSVPDIKKQAGFSGTIWDIWAGWVSTKCHWLVCPAFSTIYRNSFAAKTIRKSICLIDAGGPGLFGEIDGLADGGVAVLLKGGLHPDMPFG